MLEVGGQTDDAFYLTPDVQIDLFSPQISQLLITASVTTRK